MHKTFRYSTSRGEDCDATTTGFSRAARVPRTGGYSALREATHKLPHPCYLTRVVFGAVTYWLPPPAARPGSRSGSSRLRG